uniref:Uncharacterized protein n=1 Tax=Anopheles albimanus TaxID=7167 RepID=A0A182FWI1_ANOAL
MRNWYPQIWFLAAATAAVVIVIGVPLLLSCPSANIQADGLRGHFHLSQHGICVGRRAIIRTSWRQSSKRANRTLSLSLCR